MRALSVIAFAVGATATALLGTAPAHAQEYPWCVQYGGIDAAINCGFASWERCMATRSGNGGYCYRNPFYREDSYAQQPSHRKHRPR